MMSQRDGGRVPVSPFADPSEVIPVSTSRPPLRSSPLNPNQPSVESYRASRRSTTNASTSTQPPSRNSDTLRLSPSGSGSSESGELQEIQNGHIGGGYGPYPVRSPYELLV